MAIAYRDIRSEYFAKNGMPADVAPSASRPALVVGTPLNRCQEKRRTARAFGSLYLVLTQSLRHRTGHRHNHRMDESDQSDARPREQPSSR
jgi:hypothetical protein